MSLLKLPFIASMTWGLQVTMSPPNPPPPLNEQIKPSGMEILAPWFPLAVKVGGHKTAQACFWALSLCECAVIIAGAFPSSSVSNQVVRALGNPKSNADPYSAISAIRIHYPFIIGWFLNLVGSLLRWHCYRVLDSLFTFELSIRRDHKLITTGPYSIVRHPSYIGALLSGIGVSMWHFSHGSWLLECSGLISDIHTAIYVLFVLGGAIATVALVPRMKREDAILKRAFGKEWEEWVQRVPYRLIPGIY